MFPFLVGRCFACW